MIGTVQVKVQAATPNLPLQPLFAFKGSPSSLRIMDVPKSIGQWNINEVSVLVKYPDNSQDEKQAVRTGNVWVATVEGCEVTGRVVKGYEVLANGVDEDGNPVVGYVLGSGDVFVLERDSSIPEKDVEKFYVKFCETLPAKPQKGDVVDDGGTVKMYDGTKWIDMGGGSAEEVGDATLTIKKNGINVGNFTANSFTNKTIDIPVPSTTNDLVNDSGFITSAAIPSTVSSFENDVGYLTSVSWGEVQGKPDVALKSEIPSNVSELVNDVGYITASAIPSTVGAFQNDVGYLTSVSWGEVSDKPNVALMSDIPSKVSELENDSGYITANALPTKVSELQNDSGFITLAQVPTPSYIEDANGNSISADLSFFSKYPDAPWMFAYEREPTVQYTLTKDELGWAYTPPEPWDESSKQILIRYRGGNMWDYIQLFWNGSEWQYDTSNETSAPEDAQSLVFDGTGAATRSYTASGKLATKGELPTKTSDLVNDSGFITASAIPSNVGAFTNDVGYLTTSSQAFVDKRDKTDMDAVVGTTYASWNLSALHSTTYSPALELKWGTYNVFGQKQECWLVDDEYRQVCFFLLPELNMLFWGVRNQDGSYIAGYGETITLSSDELSVATINGVAEITCTRTTKEGSPEISTIATLKDLSEYEGAQDKRDWWDNTYPASVDDSGRYTINNFSVMVGSNSYVLDQFSKNGSTSTWKTTGGEYPSITTTDGLNFALNTDSSTYSNFSIGQLKPGPATGTIGGNNYSALANFKLTTFALKDYVDAQASSIPSATSDLVNDSGFITASAIPSSYSAIMDSSGCVVNANLSAVYYEEVSKWVLTIYGKTYTLDGPKTRASWSASAPYSQGDTRGTITYGSGNYWTLDWNYYDGSDWGDAMQDYTEAPLEATSLQFDNIQVQSCVWTSGFSELVSGTLATKSDLQDVISAIPSNVSELNNDVGYITADAIPPIPSKTSDLVNDSGFITASAIPSNVGAFNNDVGYLTASSSSFTNKRDYDDLTYPGTVYPSETHRIREFDLNIEGGYNPRRYTLNKFSTNVPNYGSMWANEEEYWNFAVATSNGEDFTFNKYGESGEVATFTMSDLTAGAIVFTMTDDQIEYTCHLSASMYETTLALKDYVDAQIGNVLNEQF